MAVRVDKTRVQVTLSKAVCDKLDALCERTGMTRSAFISYTVAMALDSYDGLLDRAATAVTAEDVQKARG